MHDQKKRKGKKVILEFVDLQAATIGDIGEYDNVIFIESQDSIEMVSRNPLCDVPNPIDLSQDEPRGSQVATQTQGVH